MNDAALLALHPDRARFPERVLAQVRELEPDASAALLAWELSGLAPGLDGERRLKAFALALALLASQGQGHTRMALAPAEGSPGDLVLRAFGLEGLEAAAFLEDPDLAPLVGGPGDAKPLIVEGGWLLAQRLRLCERDLAARAASLAATALPAMPVPGEVFGEPFPLNPLQRQAVERALDGALTLVTGGPGTGKTSILVALLRALLLQPGILPEDIALAAPTGKAAQRCREAVRASLERLGAEPGLLPEPRTLHRLLAWHPAAERFRHGPGNPLPFKAVIVDESSMVSLEHLARLLGALAPGARLVLLGDAEQLPSVDPGTAFRDLVEGLPGRSVRLAESYRMRAEDPGGRNILSVAGAVREDRPGDFWAGPEPVRLRASFPDLAFQGVELVEPGGDGMRAFLRAWFEGVVTGLPDFPARAGRVFGLREGAWAPGDEAAIAGLFAHFDRFRILCALREAPDLRGVEGINALLHGWMAPVTGEGLRARAAYYAGEPVLMTANDYRREIFNGDQGLVLKVRFDGEVRQAAVFPRAQGFKAFPLEPLRPQLEHAYAMTVHKAQGSEHDRVAVVLPRADHKALTRELVYTALTRARTSVVLLAERERLPFASGNPVRRDSGVRERLEAGLAR